MRTSGVWLAFLGSIVILAALIALLTVNPEGSETSKDPVVVFCAAGVRAPVEAVAREYEKTYGVSIQLQYGNSQSLLTSAEVSRRGDLYLPGDDSYIALGVQKQIVDETIPLARMKAILAVRKGNPKGVRSIADLLRPEVKTALANPEAAVGKLTRDALSREWDELKKRAAVFKPTVSDIANDVKLGTVDAGFVWDAMLPLYPELEPVDTPQLAQAVAHLSIGVLRSTRHPAAALRFARYLGARDKGLKEFAKLGYAVVDGDAWAETPELQIMVGAMLRPAIEKTISEFERREGARVSRKYNGCGILVAEMKTGQHPDAYFACDQSFMNEVKDLFFDSKDISVNQLVILTKKGNPHGLKSLKDLGKPGLKVGVGHEKQCALGVITKQTLVEGGVYAKVEPNIVVRKPTGDMLVVDLRAGALDAIVAYVSNGVSARDEMEAISIDIPCAIAVQPIAVGRESKNKLLASRLVRAIQASKDRFLSEGFGWKAPQ